eukprot:TRINITY_DN16633_c0_g1_i1.p1 TRINITY_DN16633_c0_g1~~TRINITY_DN16633_c0_g1_i1.p1  ORF type:complete len:366 (-),score=116.16 TRINITY_DN16633_c0_g1_i1:44-1141(-)
MSSLPYSAAGQFEQELIATARKIASPGKGILAADESTGTIGSRFSKINLENNSENRRAYRELLFTTPGLNEYISGTILFDETLMEHKTKDGSKRLADLLLEQGIVIGIKVDAGLKALPGTNGELAVQGLTDLGDRCKKYYEAGARFAKWRAAFTIDLANGKPSELCVREQAWGLGRYAAICQANGLVPIVEPEVLMDGAHDIDVCARVSEHVYATVVKALHDNGVVLEGSLLKPNMITPGASAPKVSPQVIGEYTVRTLARTIPPAMTGVTFLSGGQTEEEATINLDAINKVGGNMPWKLSFSYGRALQASTIKAWDGKAENVEAAQKVLLARAKANSEAQLGKYAGGAAAAGSEESLFQKNYTY